jgi:serine/threonine protein kinase/Flp pilus assembly protein TadD
MGVVYKAEDTRLKRTVALKFLPPELTRDPDAKERFVHEAQAASALQHTNICVVHDVDETADRQIFICMEYYEGETLKKKIEHGPLKIDEAVDIGIQVAQGLAKAHEAGMVHRDIKPANVMVTKDGVPKIVDFGLAKLAGQTRLTRTGTTLGTIAYMSPEQARGEIADRRSDLWSLGAVMYEMVTGLLPFKGEHESAALYAILNTEPEPMSALRAGVPHGLEEIVHKALSKDPAERYQHADEVVADLHRLRHESERSAILPTISKARPRKRRQTVLISAGALLLLTAAFFILKPLLFDDLLVSEPKPIAVISFVNQTGDKAYDYLQEAIPSLLITDLEQSKYLRVTTWERMLDLLEQLGKKDVHAIDRDLGFELCQRNGIEAIALGTFTKAGNMFATEVKVLDVHSKELLKSAIAKGEGVESILKDQIDELSREISRGVGLSERSIAATRLHNAGRTTSSMDAYNYYLRGRAEYFKYDYAAARQFLLKAISLDTSFSSAYLLLGLTSRQLGNSAEAIQAFQKARQHAQRATIKEQLYADAGYASAVENNHEKAAQFLTKIVQMYPQEKDAYLLLGMYYSSYQGAPAQGVQYLQKALELDPGFPEAINQLAYIYAARGDFEEAVKYLKRYAATQPGDPNPFDSMAEIYFKMGRLDEAIAKYREALDVKPDFESSHSGLAYIYALKEDFSTANRHVADVLALTDSQSRQAYAYCGVALARYLTGEFRESLRNLRKATEIAESSGNAEPIALALWIQGWIAFDRGELSSSRHQIAAWYDACAKSDTSLGASSRVGYCLAIGLMDLQAGRIDSAKAQLIRARSVLPEVGPSGKSMAEFRHALLSVGVLLAQDSVDAALALCRKLRPLPIPTFSTSAIIYYNVPFARDMPARVYLKAGSLDSAIAEYRRLTVFDPSSPDRRFIHPKYHYRLAMLYDRKGMKGEAIHEYRRFLELWKDADGDLPEPIDARKRLAVNLAQRQY